MLEDLHAREERVEVGGDDLLEQHVRALTPTSISRGRIGGTLIRAKSRSPVSGSRTVTASDSDRSLMYGNGWPGSTASGVSTGKISSKKRCAQLQVALRPLVVADDADALLGQLVADRGERLGVLGDHRQQPRPDRVERLRGAHAVGRRARPAGLDLLLQAGDADLEELVEVAGEDGQEADALEQRVALVDRPRTARAR